MRPHHSHHLHQAEPQRREFVGRASTQCAARINGPRRCAPTTATISTGHSRSGGSSLVVQARSALHEPTDRADAPPPQPPSPPGIATAAGVRWSCKHAVRSANQRTAPMRPHHSHHLHQAEPQRREFVGRASTQCAARINGPRRCAPTTATISTGHSRSGGSSLVVQARSAQRESTDRADAAMPGT